MNTVEIKCPGCGAEYSLGEEYWDRNVVCPACETTFYLAPPMESAGTADWQFGQAVLDDFTVEGFLGEGGMGKVYRLRSRSTGSQFAVKRAKGLEEADRRNFLTELQTWIDLPEHPNLVPCRFFRTVDDEVLIFAEYVEGGSLREWIDSRKLYEGGSHQALERMLDVAIQFAWGLHCVHELGLVHQDVKPGNVLMGTDRRVEVQGVKPMVTDFGLARARSAAGEMLVSDPSRSILVSNGGGTPAYWSPEQAQGLQLTRKTDIWSWGVSVLEMFSGEVTWMSGIKAAEILELYLYQDRQDGVIPAMPGGVVDLLEECFRDAPAARPTSLAEAVETLKAIYRESVNADYSRPLNVIEQTALPKTGIKARRHASGTAWMDPQAWLEKGLRAAGRDPAEAASFVAQRGMTRRGELVAELAVYDEAKRVFEETVQEGRKELECDLARLCVDKALVHRTAGDEHGALQEYDQAITILERLVNQEGRPELVSGLAWAYTDKANAFSDLGDRRGALALYDQAIGIWERLVNQEGRREVANDLAMTYMNKAAAVSILGDKRGSAALCDQAIAIQERLVNHEGRRELANELAATYMNKAVVVSELGDHSRAVAVYDQAIEIWERLVNQDGRHELANRLAMAYMNKADAVSALGDHCGAMAFYDRALATLEQLVNQEGRRELVNDLAKIYTNKAGAVNELGDKRGAVALNDQAIGIWERLVNQEGRRELANYLAVAYMNNAIMISALGDHRRAVALYDQAVAIRERLVNQEGRSELARGLAMTYVNKAGAVSALGDSFQTVPLYNQAIEILERLVNQEGHREAAHDLAMTYTNKSIVVSSLGDHYEAAALCDQAIGIWERLVNQEGHLELADYLAATYMNNANTVRGLGDNRRAVALCDQAVAIRERQVNQEGRRELVGDLASLKAYRGDTLIALGEKTRGLQDMRSAHSILQAEIARTGQADLKEALAWLQQQLAEHSGHA